MQNEVFGFRHFETLQDVFIAFFAAFVPVYADLLRICDGSRQQIRRDSRNLDGVRAYFTVSTFLQRRPRSGQMILDFGF